MMASPITYTNLHYAPGFGGKLMVIQSWLRHNAIVHGGRLDEVLELMPDTRKTLLVSCAKYYDGCRYRPMTSEQRTGR
jgi:hypothetical protein